MCDVGVIIVNYRTPSLVVECLLSLVAEDVRVVVVDNASGDDSLAIINAAVLAAGWSWVEVVAHPHNHGFAAGNNVGLRYFLTTAAPPKYFWLLNPDTVVRAGACRPLVAFLETNRDVGIVGSRLEDPDGTPQTSAFRFPSLLGEVENNTRVGIVTRALTYFRVPIVPKDQPHPADWVSGASLMLRREVFDSVGPLDDGYFLYFEETDYCRRARTLGWRIWHIPASRVVHLEGQSTGITGRHTVPRRRPTYWFDARSRYFRKHHGTTYTLFADLLFIVCFAFWRGQRWLRRKPDPDPPHFLRDFVSHAIRRWW